LASDSSLGKIYAENIDFSVDYENGKIIRISSGSIPAGSSCVVFYLFYKIYVKNQDYQIDYVQGKIKRVSSGSIESGQWVLLDYKVEYGFLEDDIMANSVEQAHALVLDFIDSTYKDSTDFSLVVAETFLAVSLLCNIKALESLSLNANNKNLANSFRDISKVYSEHSYAILSKYAKSIGGLKSPQAV
jgi:hypothetical protein